MTQRLASYALLGKQTCEDPTMAETNTTNSFNWSSFFLGAISGALVSLLAGIMLVVILIASVAAIGSNAEATFDQIAAELEADADGATFDAMAGVDVAAEPFD